MLARRVALKCVLLACVGAHAMLACGCSTESDPQAAAYAADANPTDDQPAATQPPEPATPRNTDDGTVKNEAGDTPATAAAPPADDTVSGEEKPASGDTAVAQPQDPSGKPAAAPEADNPFPRRIPAPDFPKDAIWLNTGGPLRKQDLKGKFVLFDFWTYCCINCMHILPELKKLERAHPNDLVVIGVHSAKFDNEKDTRSIEEAILRYEIEHPVVNDADHAIWDSFNVRAWPSLVVMDPEGFVVAQDSGEFQFEQLDAFFNAAIPFYRRQGLLDETPIRFDRLAERQQDTALRFPGKILADEAGGRLFISDSNHNRIVITDLDGKRLDVIGSGAIGKDDGNFETAAFDHPQGVALQGPNLYVADTENHLLRKVDLPNRRVTTIAGLGIQSRNSWPGSENVRSVEDLPRRWVGKPKETALNSPWALWVHETSLFIAMAGPHQIWKMPLDESEIGPYAGNGREDIVDGLLIPTEPYGLETQPEGQALPLPVSSFAQPSGLASDGQWLFVADSEGSSIRAVPLDPTAEVKTLLGTSQLPRFMRLFKFGDRDGIGLLKETPPDADAQPAPDGQAAPADPALTGPLLQHALDVAYHEGRLFIADTYNNKVKVLDVATSEVKTLAGTGQPGRADNPAQFDEPAGLAYARGTLYVADTNNHAIRTIDLASGQVGTLTISGLSPPKPPAASQTKPDFAGAAMVTSKELVLKAVNGRIDLNVELQLPQGWKINPLAPMAYYLDPDQDRGPIDRDALGKKSIEQPSATFLASVPVTGEGADQIRLALNFYYCQDGGEGLCRAGSVVFTIPLQIDPQAESSQATLRHSVEKAGF